MKSTRRKMNRQESSSIQGFPSVGRVPARASRGRLFLTVLVTGMALAFLGYRIYRTLSVPHREPRLVLGANVPLLDAPPLPADDRLAVRERLQRFAFLRANTPFGASDPAAHLAVARAALQADDSLAAYEEFHVAFQGHPPADLAIHNAYGLCALELGLYPQALEIYKSMVARWPHRADGYIGLTRAQYYLGAMRPSVATLDRAARAVPSENIPDQLHIAYEYEQKGALERALAVEQAVRAVAPDDPLALKVTAHLLFKLVRLGEARKLLEKLTAEHPEDSGAAIDLAAIVDNPMLPERDRGLAEHMLLQVLQRAPTNAQAFTQLGTIYQEQERYRQAAYVYVRLLQLTPDSPSGRMQLSRAYAALGEQRRAAAQREIGQQLLERDRTESHLSATANHHARDPQARLALARYYVSAGQFGNALEQLQAAYCLSPDSPEIRRALSTLYDRIGVPDLRVDIARFAK